MDIFLILHGLIRPKMQRIFHFWGFIGEFDLFLLHLVHRTPIAITFLFSKVSRASKTIGSLLKNNRDCQCYSVRFSDLHFFSM